MHDFLIIYFIGCGIAGLLRLLLYEWPAYFEYEWKKFESVYEEAGIERNAKTSGVDIDRDKFIYTFMIVDTIIASFLSYLEICKTLIDVLAFLQGKDN